ncbi:hypothetical protein [Spirosoma jeollabukense]
MKHARKLKSTPSPVWVEFASPNQPTHWQRVSRLLALASESERINLLHKFRTGQQVVFEKSGICIQTAPMSSLDRKRLTHLLSFEASGFKLIAFDQGMALYGKGLESYHCMAEAIERGFLPVAGIHLNPNNTPIYNKQGELINVMVLVNQEHSSFYLNPTLSGQQDSVTPSTSCAPMKMFTLFYADYQLAPAFEGHHVRQPGTEPHSMLPEQILLHAPLNPNTAKTIHTAAKARTGQRGCVFWVEWQPSALRRTYCAFEKSGEDTYLLVFIQPKRGHQYPFRLAVALVDEAFPIPAKLWGIIADQLAAFPPLTPKKQPA